MVLQREGKTWQQHWGGESGQWYSVAEAWTILGNEAK